MDNVNRAQIRAARALLNWSQPDLANAADVALTTIKKFESGERKPIRVIKAAIVRALEKQGVQFQYDGKQAGVSIGVRKLPKE